MSLKDIQKAADKLASKVKEIKNEKDKMNFFFSIVKKYNKKFNNQLTDEVITNVLASTKTTYLKDPNNLDNYHEYAFTVSFAANYFNNPNGNKNSIEKKLKHELELLNSFFTIINLKTDNADFSLESFNKSQNEIEALSKTVQQSLTVVVNLANSSDIIALDLKKQDDWDKDLEDLNTAVDNLSTKKVPSNYDICDYAQKIANAAYHLLSKKITTNEMFSDLSLHFENLMRGPRVIEMFKKIKEKEIQQSAKVTQPKNMLGALVEETKEMAEGTKNITDTVFKKTDLPKIKKAALEELGAAFIPTNTEMKVDKNEQEIKLNEDKNKLFSTKIENPKEAIEPEVATFKDSKEYKELLGYKKFLKHSLNDPTNSRKDPRHTSHTYFCGLIDMTVKNKAEKLKELIININEQTSLEGIKSILLSFEQGKNSKAKNPNHQTLYQVLNTGQNFTTRFFGLKTSTIKKIDALHKSLDTMILKQNQINGPK